MISWGRHSERAIAATVAVLLQAALYSALSHRHPLIRSATSAPAILAMILTVVRPKREPPPVRHSSQPGKPRLVSEHAATPPSIPSQSQKQSSRSAFDWEGAIPGEVRKQLTRPVQPPKLTFGFPAMPVEKGLPQWDGWDDVRIDRVQRLAHGVIDLGNGCFILLFPPIPQCPAAAVNGDLFKNLHNHHPDEIPGALP